MDVSLSFPYYFNRNDQMLVPISSNRATHKKIFSLFKQALRPLISLFSMLSNKWHTGFFLTSSQVLLSEMGSASIKYWEHLSLYEELKQETEKKITSGASFITFIHTPSFNYIGHSTMLAIGRTKQDRVFALFFDAHGGAPSQTKLIKTMLSGPWEGRSVEELYKDLTATMVIKPTLLFSTSHIQADFVSCTAYTAVFQQKLTRAFNADNFSPEAFIQSIANDEAISFYEVRKVVSNTFR